MSQYSAAKELSASNLARVYKGLRVLITGHTGFKGSWLALWLKELGADVVGYSAYLPSDPCNFVVCGLEQNVKHIEGDVRNEKNLRDLFLEYRPDVVFHLAAQPIVRRSYEQPKLTFETNLIGTINVLECIRQTSSVRAGVLITSDKCYENVEWYWGYRETDRLGGKDPYSASKACAEIAASSYFRSYFSDVGMAQLATARAGNVIGGGDWAADRIVPDCVRAFSSDKLLKIRNPLSTRPWQHVLEPLSGYLWLGACLVGKYEGVAGEAFNFGPGNDVSCSVGDLICEMAKKWGFKNWQPIMENDQEPMECGLLKLNCDRALNVLGWHAAMSFDETVRMTAEWYKAFYKGEHDMRSRSISQIKEYSTMARERGLQWAM